VFHLMGLGVHALRTTARPVGHRAPDCLQDGWPLACWLCTTVHAFGVALQLVCAVHIFYRSAWRGGGDVVRRCVDAAVVDALALASSQTRGSQTTAAAAAVDVGSQGRAATQEVVTLDQCYGGSGEARRRLDVYHHCDAAHTTSAAAAPQPPRPLRPIALWVRRRVLVHYCRVFYIAIT
jgi:hypothetical protein